MTNAPPFTFCTPIFSVSDLSASLVHYREVLGWTVEWQWSDEAQFEGGAPTFACVRRGEVTLFLGQERQGSPGSWIFLNVATLADLEALHDELSAKGARIAEPPSDCPWGMREMLVQDLDGNTLRIGAPAGEGGLE